MKKKIAILGSTGSIGKTLIEILKKDKKNIEIVLLTANKNTKEILKQVKSFKPKNLVITDIKEFLKIKEKLRNTKINLFNDFKLLNKVFKRKQIDYTMSSISGLDGLDPTLKIIKYTKKIAIANKESIICGWSLIKNELNKNGTIFIPVDSEHFSVWSLINQTKDENIEKVYLTASGGPFINLPLKKYKSITLLDSLKHPNWQMGKKISIDSATMMNKVFEIIEAKKIFDLNYNQLEILIHKKSYAHALVKFKNGITKILIHDTNMTVPIFNSLYSNYEKKLVSKKIDFTILNNLNFEKIDKKRFPVVNILNTLTNKNTLFETIIVSANDKLVNLFLDKKIKFTDISKILLKIIYHKDFKKFRAISPKNVEQIKKISNYVSLKIDSLSI